MAIICEGMDNSGKTTLVKHLAAKYGLPTLISAFAPRGDYKKKGKHPHMMAEVAVNFVGLMNSNFLFVSDRFPLISEAVYGPICAGNDDILDHWGEEKYKLLMQDFLDMAPFIIYCRPSRDVIMNFGDREQMDGVIERSEALLEAYDSMMHQLREGGHDVFYYDYTNPESLTELEELLDAVVTPPSIEVVPVEGQSEEE